LRKTASRQARSGDFSRWLCSVNDQSRYYKPHNGNCWDEIERGEDDVFQ
jgi:hypothetical protein